jgi:hypothetical protein
VAKFSAKKFWQYFLQTLLSAAFEEPKIKVCCNFFQVTEREREKIEFGTGMEREAIYF